MKSKLSEKLNAIAVDESSNWLQKAKWREDNKAWLNRSARIAIKILREIRRQKEMNGMSQKKLAEMLHVSPQNINRILRGEDNLSLETISRIEKALSITLMEVPGFGTSQTLDYNPVEIPMGINRNHAELLVSKQSDYKKFESHDPSETQEVA